MVPEGAGDRGEGDRRDRRRRAHPPRASRRTGSPSGACGSRAGRSSAALLATRAPLRADFPIGPLTNGARAGSFWAHPHDTCIHPAVTDALHWRYATKKFDPARKIPAATGPPSSRRSSCRRRRWACSPGSSSSSRTRPRGRGFPPPPGARASRSTARISSSSRAARAWTPRTSSAYLARMAEVRGVTRESLNGFAQMHRTAAPSRRARRRPSTPGWPARFTSRSGSSSCRGLAPRRRHLPDGGHRGAEIRRDPRPRRRWATAPSAPAPRATARADDKYASLAQGPLQARGRDRARLSRPRAAMRALRIEAVGRVALSRGAGPVPAPGEAVVELRAAALNHRDVWIKLGQYAGLRYPCIPGSDGAGVVASVGPGADPSWVGREVVINPGPRLGRVRGRAGARFHDPRAAARRDARAAGRGPRGAARREARRTWPGRRRRRSRSPRSRPGGRSSAGPGWRRASASSSPGSAAGSRSSRSSSRSASGNEAWVTSELRREDRAGGRDGRAGADSATTAGGWAAERGQGAGPVRRDHRQRGRPGLRRPDRRRRARAAGSPSTAPPGATCPRSRCARCSGGRSRSSGSTMGSPADWSAMTAFVARQGLRPVISDVFPLERGGRRRST